MTPGSGHGICGYAASGSVAGVLGPFVGGGAEIAAVGVASFGVVAGQPAEDLAAAGGCVGPAAAVLEDFAFEGGVERFGQRVVSTRTRRAPIDWVTPRSRAEFREIL